ncbi:MAG: PIN domain-containing protein [Candidatus Latescibacterota bacterium]
MDRLFLDANVLFSMAYGSPGIGRLWDLCRSGQCRLLASRYVVAEAQRNLDGAVQQARLAAALSDVDLVAEAPQDLACPVPQPPKDQPVLLAALAVRATHLVTGDLLHFGAWYGKSIRGTHVCTPAQYLARASSPPDPSPQ